MKIITIKIKDYIDALITTSVPPKIVDEPIFEFHPLEQFLVDTCLEYEMDLKFFDNELKDEPTELQIINKIIETWNTYIGFIASEINKIYETLNIPYNVLENYNLENTNLYGYSSTKKHNDNLRDGQIVNTTIGDGNSNYVKNTTIPYNTGDEQPRSANYNATNLTDTRNYNNFSNNLETYYDAEISKTLTDISVQAHEIEQTIMKKHGNIGITSYQALIKGEINLRRKNYVRAICNGFKNMHMFLIV